jgi:tyrosine-protein phosphatase YwqE
MELIEKGLVDFIGTDLHNHRHADAIESYLASKEYRKIKDRLPLLNNSI